jgi:cytochrome P450
MCHRFMCHDDKYFPSPDIFYPERHLNEIEEAAGEMSYARSSDPKRIVFGFGRRICPGEHLADAMLWTAMAFALATFDILPPIDPKTGVATVPKAAFTSGGSRYV